MFLKINSMSRVTQLIITNHTEMIIYYMYVTIILLKYSFILFFLKKGQNPRKIKSKLTAFEVVNYFKILHSKIYILILINDEVKNQ